MGIVIGRHINGISLNSLEYVLDDGGEIKEFDNEKKAKEFLSKHGITDFDFIYFKDSKEI